MTRKPQPAPIAIGWREWVALPDLGIPAIKVKIDTGARTSALHASKVERYTRRGAPHAILHIHPLQRSVASFVKCDVAIIDERLVMSSGGHRERRIVIASTLALGGAEWPIELSVTDRDPMRFRMLLGRSALAGRVIIIPGASYLLGERARRRRAGREPRD